MKAGHTLEDTRFLRMLLSVYLCVLLHSPRLCKHCSISFSRVFLHDILFIKAGTALRKFHLLSDLWSKISFLLLFEQTIVFDRIPDISHKFFFISVFPLQLYSFIFCLFYIYITGWNINLGKMHFSLCERKKKSREFYF